MGDQGIDWQEEAVISEKPKVKSEKLWKPPAAEAVLCWMPDQVRHDIRGCVGGIGCLWFFTLMGVR